MTTRRRTKLTRQPCVSCSGTMRWETRDDEVEYQGRRGSLKTTGFWCSSCGEAILDGSALAVREKAFFELRAEVDGVLAPDEVARIRRRLGLTQKQAGDLLGGGPQAFYKYESGRTPPSVAMSQLLRLLDKDPKRLRDLERTHRTRGSGGRNAA